MNDTQIFWTLFLTILGFVAAGYLGAVVMVVFCLTLVIIGKFL